MENSFSSAPENSGTGTTGAPLVEQVKQQTQQVVQQAGEKAGQAVEQVRSQVKSRLSEQKEQAAGSLGTVAQAIRQTGETLRTGNQPAVAQCADTTAQFVEQLSGYLQGHEIDDLVEDVENFARTNPAVFLGTAFALGFMAARFLKSSTPAPAVSGGGNGSTYGGYSGAYDTGTSAYDSTDALVPATPAPAMAAPVADLDLIPDQFESSSTGGGAAVGLGGSSGLGASTGLGASSGLGGSSALGVDADAEAGLGGDADTDLDAGLGTGADADLDNEVDAAPDLITRSDDR